MKNVPAVYALRAAGPTREPQISRLVGVVHTTANALITVFGGLCQSHFQHNADGGVNDATGIPTHTLTSLLVRPPSLSPRRRQIPLPSPDGTALVSTFFFLFCFVFTLSPTEQAVSLWPKYRPFINSLPSPPLPPHSPWGSGMSGSVFFFVFFLPSLVGIA